MMAGELDFMGGEHLDDGPRHHDYGWRDCVYGPRASSGSVLAFVASAFRLAKLAQRFLRPAAKVLDLFDELGRLGAARKRLVEHLVEILLLLPQAPCDEIQIRHAEPRCKGSADAESVLIAR